MSRKSLDVEYFVLTHDDCIGIVYKHETLGRVLVIRENINIENKISIHPASDIADKAEEIDMLDFILRTIPNEPKTKN